MNHQRNTILLALVAGALILASTSLPDHAALLWVLGSLLLLTAAVTAVAAWRHQRSTPGIR